MKIFLYLVIEIFLGMFGFTVQSLMGCRVNLFTMR